MRQSNQQENANDPDLQKYIKAERAHCDCAY